MLSRPRSDLPTLVKRATCNEEPNLPRFSNETAVPALVVRCIVLHTLVSGEQQPRKRYASDVEQVQSVPVNRGCTLDAVRIIRSLSKGATRNRSSIALLAGFLCFQPARSSPSATRDPRHRPRCC